MPFCIVGSEAPVCAPKLHHCLPKMVARSPFLGATLSNGIGSSSLRLVLNLPLLGLLVPPRELPLAIGHASCIMVHTSSGNFSSGVIEVRGARSRFPKSTLSI